MRKKNTQKNIYYAKMLSTNWLLIFIAILMVCIAFAFIYINDQMSYQKTVDNNIQAQIDNIRSTTIPSTEDSLLIDYYRELSNKTDEAINRILVIVGIIATIITLFGLFFAFKAPHDIDKRIDELNKTLLSSQEAAEEAKYQAEIANALTEETNHMRIVSLSDVIKRFPNKPDAFNYRGYLNQRNGNYDNALSDYENARQLGIKKITYYQNISIVYNCKDDYKNSIKCSNEAIKLDSGYSNAYVVRAFSYINLKDYEKAMLDLEEALFLNPENDGAYFYRSYLYEKLQQIEENQQKKEEYKLKAKADFDMACKIDPEFKEYIEWKKTSE